MTSSFPLATSHIWVHHLAHDRPWPNDGNLNNYVVELRRMVSGKRSHLRAALDLKHADSIGTLQHSVDVVIFRQLGQIHSVSVVLRNQLETILENSHHAQTEQIHLDDAEIGTVFLIPLHHGPSRHGSAFQRNDAVQLALADHHAARVLSKMTW